MAKEKCDDHSGCVNQIKTNTKSITTLFTKVTRIENRPPVWMSLSFAVAIGVIGWLVKGA